MANRIWKQSLLSEVCEVNPGKKDLQELDKDTVVSFLPMALVSEDGKIIDKEERKLKEVIKGYTNFRDGDVLLAKITPCFENGKRAIAKNLTNGVGFGSTEFHVLRSKGEVTSDWIFHAISRADFCNIAKSQMTGTAGQKRVPTRVLEQFKIPVPSIKEQEEISGNIETQFTRLESTIKSLKTVKAKLSIYRKSVLKAAFKPGKNEEWQSSPISQIVRIIDYRGRTPPYSGSGIPHLRSANIKKGKIIWEKMKYVSDETYDAYMTRGLPEKGDVLFTTEAPLGEVAISPDIKFSMAQRMVLLRPKADLIHYKFLLYQIISDSFQGALMGKGTGTTVTGVSSRNFKTIQIVFPDNTPRQEEIVDEIESRFSVIDKLETVIDASLSKAETLRKSILKSAFEGKLVN